MLVEILKNSCRATLELHHTSGGPVARPINVLICGDQREVVIRVSDRGNGIPFDVGGRVWSYSYSAENESEGGNAAGKERSERNGVTLAGSTYGAGLPLSRLYARYLGGSLDLLSWPGYGTDVFIVLPRLNQVEVVPDKQAATSFKSS
mmetsp:Transcript_19602/g.45951  ORF Transcript_19602/g.45951 Transcript_19602/m.45951 type:complete len:148 (-) Transcript_19602:96-539(-)